MENQYLFNAYIRNNWVDESQINNTHSFDVYIKNTHSFEVALLGLSAEPSTELFWVLNIGHKYHIITNNVLFGLGLQLDVDIPKISLQIDSELITFLKTTKENADIIINAPMITSIMELSQLMGYVNIDIPIKMGVAMSESKSLTNTIRFSIQMEVEMSGSTYCMLNYYDVELLSDLDDNLLSVMDSVAI